MKIYEALEKADALAPNHYSDEQKMDWLTALDGKVCNEVFLTHEDDNPPVYPLGGYTGTGEELMIPGPYAEDIYVNFLLAKIAEENAEIARYNLYTALFNTEYAQFAGWYHRTHRPKTGEGWRF